MQIGLSYDDVAMIPKFNNIPSRLEPDLSTRLTVNTPMAIPIVAANMDSVIGSKLASVLKSYGSIPIFHRFFKDKSELTKLVTQYDNECFVSCGVSSLDEISEWLDSVYPIGPRGICIDIAHGHSVQMLKTIEELKRAYQDLEIIGGNVCTSQAFHDLVNAGADAVKVGIGPGSVCRTRNVTAFGTPQFTAVLECGKLAKEFKVPLIADGGIKGSRDIILALAAGASSVMVGGLFAKTLESAGEGFYRGQASAEFQTDFYGEIKQGTVAEGIETFIAPHDRISASQLLDELLGGIRSGMTYGGARTIWELQRKAEFIRVTPSYMQ